MGRAKPKLWLHVWHQKDTQGWTASKTLLLLVLLTRRCISGPVSDEHECLAGSDLDNKVVVEGRNMLALPPDVVEREQA